MNIRPLCKPRLAPGTRITYHPAKWTLSAKGVELSPAGWESVDWAQERAGVVVDAAEFLYHGESAPGDVPDHATPIRFDGRDTVTWYRTSCLDVVDTPPCITVHQVDSSDQTHRDGGVQPMLFAGEVAQ